MHTPEVVKVNLPDYQPPPDALIASDVNIMYNYIMNRFSIVTDTPDFQTGVEIGVQLAQEEIRKTRREAMRLWRLKRRAARIAAERLAATKDGTETK